MKCPWCDKKVEMKSERLSVCVPCGISWYDGELYSARRKNKKGWDWIAIPRECLVVMKEAI